MNYPTLVEEARNTLKSNKHYKHLSSYQHHLLSLRPFALSFPLLQPVSFVSRWRLRRRRTRTRPRRTRSRSRWPLAARTGNRHGCRSKLMGSHLGIGAPPILVHLSGDWDVHKGYGIVTHGYMRSLSQNETPRRTRRVGLVGTPKPDEFVLVFPSKNQF